MPMMKEEEVLQNTNFQHHGRVKLFDKVVTVSDIKQYRLSIPIRDAQRHFNKQYAGTIPAPNGSSFLFMEDGEGRAWRFKYTFWKSRRGYMLTNQWSQFVKVKGITAGDVVSFTRSKRDAGMKLYVDWRKQGTSVGVVKPESMEAVERVRNFKLFGVNITAITIE